MITVDIISEGANWNQFVEKFKPDHFAYLWEWREIISKVFGHKAYYLMAYSGETTVGVLPLFHVKSILFGSSLISVPYLNAGGILASNESAFAALLKKADELREELKVRYVEFRARNADSKYRLGFPLAVRTHKVAMVLPLPESVELLNKNFGTKLRSQIKRPTKEGIIGKSGFPSLELASSELIDDFYRVFSENMRDLGTPVYPKRFFTEISAQLAGRVKCVLTYFENSPVAAGITIGFLDSVEIPWASSLRGYNSKSPNMLLYSLALSDSLKSGYKYFDFGRSTADSSTYKFKAQWGAQPKILHWYYLGKSTEVPDVNPNSKKFRLLVSIWKKLPISVAEAIGPWLTKGLP